MPSDVVEISSEEHVALLEAQSAGKLIDTGQGGLPTAVDLPPAPPPPHPTKADLMAQIQALLAKVEAMPDGVT